MIVVNEMIHDRFSGETNGLPSSRGARYELLTVLVRKEDYEKLKTLGGPRQDQIVLALRHYLELLKTSDWRPKPPRALTGERVTTFRIAVDKELCSRIRSLGGRFDIHSLEAVRRFLA